MRFTLPSARKITTLLAAVALFLAAVPATLAAHGFAPEEHATLVTTDEPLALSVADTVGMLSSDMDITLDRAEAGDAAAVLAAIAASRHTVVLVGHGDAEGFHVGADTISWSDLAKAIDTSPAPSAILIACGSSAAAALAHKPVFGYAEEVDARVAELDAFEQLARRIYGNDALALERAKGVLWDYIARTHAQDSDLLIRLILPQEPLIHVSGHNDAHHTTGDEKSFEAEQRSGAAGGFYFEWGAIIEGFKVRKDYCDGNSCGWTIVGFEADLCKTLLSMYDLALPASNKIIRLISGKLGGGEAEILALKLCGTIWYKFNNGTGQSGGGGELALRLGAFIEVEGRWFLPSIGFEVYIQAALEWPAATRDSRHIDITIPWHVDFAAEGKLHYLYFNVNKNLGRGNLDIRICYACVGSSGAASLSGENVPATPTRATLVPGPALANHMRATGMSKALGIPAGIDPMQVELNLLDPTVDEIFRTDFARSTGVQIPSPFPSSAAAAECPGPAPRVPNVWYPDQDGDGSPDADLLSANAQTCVLSDGSTHANGGASVGDPMLPMGMSPTGVAWTLANQFAGETMRGITDEYARLYGGTGTSTAMKKEEGSDDYAAKVEFDQQLVTPPIGCLFDVIPPTSLDGPAVLPGPCYGTLPGFYHMAPGIVGHAGETASGAATLAGVMIGGGVETNPGAISLGSLSGCSSLFDRASC